MRTFLHVGCGPATKSKTTKGFNTDGWDELRLDIDPAVKPDIVGSMTDMSAVRDASVDAIFSSHNIEHLEAHEVPVALKEFRRVLDDDGFLIITCPDLQSIASLVVKDKLLDAAYETENGQPITPLDVIYGWTQALRSGQNYMAHRTGFTRSSLAAFLKAAGFPRVMAAKRGAPHFDIWMVASPKERSVKEMTELASQHLPVTPIPDPVAYKGPPRVAVCVASSGQCKSQFATSLSALQGYFYQKPLMPEKPNQELRVFLVESSSLAFNQHMLVEEARKWNATHILWVEDDMLFPQDALHQLFSRRKQWVGANYAMRVGPPYEFVALNLEGDRCFTGPDSTGLEEVLYTGYGVTLMDISIFDKIEIPYFETPWVGTTYATTDAYLAQKVRNAGIPIYVDHDLSQRVGHVGGKTYNTQEVAAWREQEKLS